MINRCGIQSTAVEAKKMEKIYRCSYKGEMGDNVSSI